MKRKSSKSDKESREILIARTKELALPVEKTEETGQKSFYLYFRIQDMHYAVSAEYVLTVISSFRNTEVPGVPDFIPGITDHRGKIIALFDLHSFLNYPSTKIKHDSQLILISCYDKECALIADTVYDVSGIPDSSIEKNVSTIDESVSRYFKGMVRIDEKLCALLDIPAIFEAEKIKSLKDLSHT